MTRAAATLLVKLGAPVVLQLDPYIGIWCVEVACLGLYCSTSSEFWLAKSPGLYCCPIHRVDQDMVMVDYFAGGGACHKEFRQNLTS